MKQWWVISGPCWTFALIERNGFVCSAAPISRWAVGKPLQLVFNWWRRKGADEIVRLDDVL